MVCTFAHTDIAASMVLPVHEYTNRTGITLDPFYDKYIDADGIPVLSSRKVQDEALIEAAFWIKIMMRNLDASIRDMLINQYQVREVVMARQEVTTDVPEHRHYKHLNWARGISATRKTRVTSSGEENLLRFGRGKDKYWDECILM